MNHSRKYEEGRDTWKAKIEEYKSKNQRLTLLVQKASAVGAVKNFSELWVCLAAMRPLGMTKNEKYMLRRGNMQAKEHYKGKLFTAQETILQLTRGMEQKAK